MVSTLMTLSEMRDAVETDASDAILQTYIDAADEDIIHEMQSDHALTGRTVSKTVNYGDRAFDILLPTQATQVTGITIDGDALNSDAYELRHNGFSVRAWFLDPFVWTSGSFTRYSWEIVVTYDAVDDTARRKRAMIYLVQHDLQHDGLLSFREGQYTETKADPAKARRLILGRLRRQVSRVA